MVEQEASEATAEVQASAAARVLHGAEVQTSVAVQFRHGVVQPAVSFRLQISMRTISFRHRLLEFKKLTTAQLPPTITVTFRWSRATQLATKGWIPTTQSMSLTLVET